MKLFKLIQHSEPRICATFWLKLLLSSRSSLEKAPLPMGNCARQLLYWIAKFPRTALEFSANPARSRTIGWPTSFSCYRYRPGEIRISGSKSRPCRRALPLVTIFSVTSLFSLSSSLPFSLSSLPSAFPSFFSFFHSVLPLVYASCLTMTYARIHAPEWNCSRSEKCFWWRVRSSPMKEVTKCRIERRVRVLLARRHMSSKTYIGLRGLDIRFLNAKCPIRRTYISYRAFHKENIRWLIII